MKKTLNLALVTALLVSAPGPLATRAVAAVVTGIQVSGSAQVLPGVSVVPSVQLGQGLSAPLTQTGVGSLSANLPSVTLGSIAQVQPAATPLRAASVTGVQAPVAKALSQVKAALTAAPAAPKAAARVSSIQSLQTGAQNLGKEDSSGGRMDWYLFAYGRDYKAGLRALAALTAWPVSIVARRSLGITWSRDTAN